MWSLTYSEPMNKTGDALTTTSQHSFQMCVLYMKYIRNKFFTYMYMYILPSQHPGARNGPIAHIIVIHIVNVLAISAAYALLERTVLEENKAKASWTFSDYIFLEVFIVGVLCAFCGFPYVHVHMHLCESLKRAGCMEKPEHWKSRNK